MPSGIFSLDNQEELCTAIELFFDTETSSEEVYNKAQNTFHCSLDRKGVDYEEIPTLFQVKECIKEITGVCPIKENMCVDTCMAFTGPFADLEHCKICKKDRSNPEILASSKGKKKIPCKQLLTLPVGPQLQVLWHTPEGANNMCYRSKLTKDILEKAKAQSDKKIIIDEYEDVFHSDAYLKAVQEEKITDDDMVLMMSIDGA